MSTSSPRRARAYETSGCTASAAFDSRVHGVVVHASNETPGSPTTGNRTYTDGSITSLYPCATSCDDSAVSQRGQYGTTLWPSYSSPLSHTCLSAHQTDSMYSSSSVRYASSVSIQKPIRSVSRFHSST